MNPHQNPTQFFTHLEKTIINVILKNINNPGLPKQSCTSRDITNPDIKLYYRATVMKSAWYWHKIRQVDQWNLIK